jgi:hypothetical protein
MHRTRIYFLPDEPIGCKQSENGCAGTVAPNGSVFKDLKIRHDSVYLCTVILEYTKFAVLHHEGVFNMSSYQSPIWQSGHDLCDLYNEIDDRD